MRGNLRHRPRFIFSEFLMRPQRIEVCAIRPSECAKFNADLLKQLGIFERCVNSRTGTIHQRRHIHDTVCTVVASDREPINRQHADSAYTPRRRRL